MTKVWDARFVFILALLPSCQNGRKGKSANNSGGKSATRYLASNVIFSSALAAAFADGSNIDQTTKVLADNIMLVDGTAEQPPGRLKSENLKSALQNEIAPVLSTVLVGQWNIELKLNTWPKATFSPTAEVLTLFPWGTGTMTFNSDLSATLDNGCAGFIHRQLCKGYDEYAASVKDPVFQWGAIKYQTIGSGVVVVTVPHPGINDTSGAVTNAVLTVAELTSDRIVLVNAAVDDDGSPLPEVALLTRVSPASAP